MMQRRLAYERARGRAGWSLLEMLVTMAVMGALTGIAVKTLTSMLLAEHRGIDHVAELATMSRLARTFRRDVHQAAKAEMASAGSKEPLLKLTIADDHQIQYEVQPLGLLRTERRPNQSAIHELWRLKTKRFQCVESTGPPRFLTLVVETLDPHPATKGKASALHELRIDALVGRDRQL